MNYEILDSSRLVSDRRERKIQWECSLRTRMKFRALLEELVDLESTPQDADTQNRAETLRDEIRGLPGFPRGYDPDRDVIVPITTSAQR